MKKSLLTFIVLPLALPLCACGKKVEVTPIRYEDSNNSVAIEDAPLDENGVLTVPSQAGGKTVVSIKSGAFENRKDIRKVVLPETILSIGSKAFAGCTNLKRINIPKSVKRVAFNCFDGDENIEVKADHTYNDWKLMYTGDLEDDKVECTTYTYNVMESGEQVAEYGKSVVLNAAPEKVGHTFSHWVVSEVEGEKSDELEAGKNEFTFEYRRNVAIEAVYTPNAYTIALNANGGETEQKSLVVKYGAVPASVEVPTRVGYTFRGYFLEEEAPFDTMVFNENGVATRMFAEPEDMEVFACWEENYYKIRFNTLGGIPTAYPGYINKVVGDKFNFPTGIPTKSGYEFKGWQYGDEKFAAGDENVEFKWGEDVEFEAIWKAKTYTVTLSLAGGTLPEGVSATQEVVYDSTYQLPIPTKEDYDFAGWQYAYYPSIDYTKGIWQISSDVTLTAQWVKHKYTISYANNSTNKIKVTYDYSEISRPDVSETYSYAQKIKLNSHYIDSEKMLEGWYTDAERTVRLSSTSVLVEDTRIYSKWVDIPDDYLTFEEVNAFEHPDDNPLAVELSSFSSSSEPVTIMVKAHESGSHIIYDRKVDQEQSSYYISIYNATTDSLIMSYNYHSLYNNYNYYYFSCSANDIILIRLYSASGDSNVNIKFANFADPAIKPFYGYQVVNGNRVATAQTGSAYHLDKQYKSGMTFVGYFTEPNGGGTKIADDNGNSLAVWSGTENITVYPHFTPVSA